jgi:hypothetical protein
MMRQVAAKRRAGPSATWVPPAVGSLRCSAPPRSAQLRARRHKETKIETWKRKLAERAMIRK